MKYQFFNLLITPLVTLISLIGIPPKAQAQVSCYPPQPGEYLVLISNPTPDIQTQVRQYLPKDSQGSLCLYINDYVLRVNGFRNIENASNWAQFVQNNVKTRTYIISPNAITNPPTTSTLSSGVIPNLQPINPIPSVVIPSFQPTIVNPSFTTNAPNTLAFNPQRLPQGYAVLIDHLNRPEIAAQVKAFIGRPVGLVSYGQRSYLLVTYTTNPNAASSTLQVLTNRGFIPLLVESDRLILLTPSIQN